VGWYNKFKKEWINLQADEFPSSNGKFNTAHNTV